MILLARQQEKFLQNLFCEKKYELLIASGHIAAFTPEQIAEANKKEENEPIRWPEIGVGANGAGMLV
jgi:hypothetical protein